MSKTREITDCPDCGCAPGDLHEPGCDVERCPACGKQLISCGCAIPWSGTWPGVEECQRLGWYARMVPGRGWVPCEKDHPDATENLNRLATDAVWNVREQRFEAKTEPRELTADLVEKLLDQGPPLGPCPVGPDLPSWGQGRRSGWDAAITAVWQLLKPKTEDDDGGKTT